MKTNYQHILESGNDNNYHSNALTNVANSEKYILTVTEFSDVPVNNAH
jgi:hypothetical protein